MAFVLPKKAQSEGASFIREVFERGFGIPGFISFGIGNPAPEAIPVHIIQAAFDEIVHHNPIELLQYGPMGGDDYLKEQTVRLVLRHGDINPHGQEVLLSNGSGQCLGLVPRTICNDGDEVYMDAYTFVNGITAVRNAGAVPVGIPMDEDGMIPEALEEAARSGKGKYIYLIPNFQNPTGITMPLERRKAIYEVARKYDLFIYEDDPYGDIRFHGTRIPPIKAIDVEDRVLYAGSYSKTLSAGLRVGFLYGPKEIIDAIQALKNNSDGQMPLVTQRVVSLVLDKIDFQKQVEHIASIYRAKCDTMVSTFATYGSDEATLTKAEGGMFVWLTLPDYVDADAFFEAAMERNVGIIKGAAFSANGDLKSNGFRLSFTIPSIDEIKEGMQIIGALTKEFCKK